jgi:hypothetical protein
VATVGLAAGVTDRILSLPGWLVLVLVFAFPGLEASPFVGFAFPGEIAVLLGGVAASRGTVPLWAVIAPAVSSPGQAPLASSWVAPQVSSRGRTHSE